VLRALAHAGSVTRTETKTFMATMLVSSEQRKKKKTIEAQLKGGWVEAEVI
jgi:hypothetical protein